MFDLESNKIIVTTKSINKDTMVKEFYVSYNFRICVILKGKAIWQINDDYYDVESKDIVLLNNRQKRAFTDVLSKDGIELLIIDFQPQLVMNTRFMGLFFRDDKYNCKITRQPDIFKIAKEIEQEYEHKLVNYHIMIGIKLFEMLTHITRYYASTSLNDNILNEDLCNALEYIDNNYTSDISLHKVADSLHMSIFSFSRLFSNSMKIGFAQYVINKKVHHAIHLLKKTNKSVLEISLECGFKNISSFYKAFKKIAGATPSEIRNTKDDYNV